jgi:hypothetical protein
MPHFNQEEIGLIEISWTRNSIGTSLERFASALRSSPR